MKDNDKKQDKGEGANSNTEGPHPEITALEAAPVLVAGMSKASVMTPDGELLSLSFPEAATYIKSCTPLLVNRALMARRLELKAMRAFDLLELFAFVRPARFCLPTVQGLADALTLSGISVNLEDQISQIIEVKNRLFADLSAETYRYRPGAKGLADFMTRGGWPWGPCVLDALEKTCANIRSEDRNSGLNTASGAGSDSARSGNNREEDGFAVWRALKEWEDQAPPPPPDDHPILPDEAISRLSSILGAQAEKRDGQKRYAGAAAYSFTPRQFEGGPNIQLLEAGTGTGKTLGYLASASLWAEKNKGPVWLATYTKALQRQLDAELDKIYATPQEKRQKAVIRKGRENYLCLLNLEETARAVMARLTIGPSEEPALIGLVLRWTRFSRDGDMIGGDFPSWLGAHFGRGRLVGLTDRRGECIYSACPHYGKCFVEKSVRRSRHADLVVANHALLIANMVNRAGDPDLPKRVVFDEGHHLFDSADAAFAVALSGVEGADLRRWLRGKEKGGATRARGLKNRLDDLIADQPDCEDLVRTLIDQSQVLPGEGWLTRVSTAAPFGPFEQFLMDVRAHIFRRAPQSDRGYGLEASSHDLDVALLASADQLQDRLSGLEAPFLALAKALAELLSDQAENFDSADRARLENLTRSILLRADQVHQWRNILKNLTDIPDPLYVSWLGLERSQGRERDVGVYRHFLDPAYPFARGVLTPLHGGLITSATLRDHISPVASTADTKSDATANKAAQGTNSPVSPPFQPDVKFISRSDTNADLENMPDTGDLPDYHNWSGADQRSGVGHLDVTARRLMVSSPFDYKNQTRILIVNDVNKNDPDQVAAAYRVLSEAAGGGMLGLFTAITRLKAIYQRLAPAMENKGKTLFAQHVDPIDVGTLIDMFRREHDSCLLGTDAVRDGVDVPGLALRMIIYDRVPWPRPTLLHKARRDYFGGSAYDDMLTRLKIAQAFGRLIRREDDRGIFVMLDARTPSRLLEALPDSVDRYRLGLKDAVDLVQDFFQPCVS